VENLQEVRSALYMGTAVMVFLACGLVFLVLYYQQHFFRMKKNEAEAMLKATLETEKKERERFAADLHDSVSGDLSAIRNYLIILSRQYKEKGNNGIFAEIRQSVEAALHSTRAISYNLMPPLLESEGLVAATKDYLVRLEKAGVKFDVNDAGYKRMDTATEYQLFRVLQEFTTNAVKYGNTSGMKINFIRESDSQVIELADNGVTFDFYKAKLNSKGSGLKNILSRLQVINAVMVQQHQDTGNRFTITLKKNIK
jgi:signal transduction histidine kinase